MGGMPGMGGMGGMPGMGGGMGGMPNIMQVRKNDAVVAACCVDSRLTHWWGCFTSQILMSDPGKDELGLCLVLRSLYVLIYSISVPPCKTQSLQLECKIPK